jgi:hypothetical protein
MNKLLALFRGKRTYLLAIIAIAYILGADQGWWAMNDEVLTAMGFGGLITLRAALRNTSSVASDPPQAP